MGQRSLGSKAGIQRKIKEPGILGVSYWNLTRIGLGHSKPKLLRSPVGLKGGVM